MREAIDNKKIIFKVIIGIFVLVWSFNVLNVGFYVDENGLLSIYKGFYQGQRLFTDSWEALQTGGILAYPLLALYYQVLSPLFASAGINIGLVLYMRIVYTICRLLVAIYLYFTIKKTVYEDGAFAASIFYYMFVMGWKNFSYKSYCDLAIMLLICFIIRFQETKKNWYFIFAGIYWISCLTVSVPIFVNSFPHFGHTKESSFNFTMIVSCSIFFNSDFF